MSQHEAPQNLFKRLPNPKDRAAGPGVSGTGTIAAASASPDCNKKMAPRTSSGSVGGK